MAETRTITLSAESYAEAVGFGCADDATRGAKAMIDAIDRVLRALDYEGQ